MSVSATDGHVGASGRTESLAALIRQLELSDLAHVRHPGTTGSGIVASCAHTAKQISASNSHYWHNPQA